MKRLSLAVLASTLVAGSAFAADLAGKKVVVAPAPVVSADGFDFALGIKAQTDYISRGVSQSDRKPSTTAYFEPRYNIGDTQIYAGVSPSLVRLPTEPFAEVDLYGGVRQTWGKFGIDVGAIYYLYPNNKVQYFTGGVPSYRGATFTPGLTVVNPIGAGPALCNAGLCATTARNPSFVEIYAKPSYNVTDSLALGANLYYSPNWNNYGHNFQSFYASFAPKYTFGETGFALSGEFGRQWLGSLRPGTIYNAAGNAKFKFPDYFAWNVGGSYTWNNITLDLRYYGTNLNKTACYVLTSDPAGNAPGYGYTGRSNWCGQRIQASVSIDLVASKDFKGVLP